MSRYLRGSSLACKEDVANAFVYDATSAEEGA